MIARPSRQAGFTLLEVLVVAIIMAVLAGVMLLSSSLAGPAAKAADARRLLIHLVNQHCEESVLLGREGGVRLVEGGYEFYWWDGEAWVPRDEKLFRPRALKPPLTLELSLPQARSELADVPEVVCDSAGEISEFNAAIVADAIRLPVTTDDRGRLVADDAG